MKKLCAFICIIALASIFVITCSAHSGGTDVHGGHMDHSSGDYHYHHGRPAHDHYDINEDGVIDCPYDYPFLVLRNKFFEKPLLNTFLILLFVVFLTPFVYYYVCTFSVWIYLKIKHLDYIDESTILYKVIQAFAIIVAAAITAAFALMTI